MLEKIGIGLGIRAPLTTIKKAAIIAENSKNVDYFFIPETHPKFMGVKPQTNENVDFLEDLKQLVARL